MPSARQIPPRNKKAYLKVSGFDGFPTAVLTASGSKGWDKIPLSKTLQPKRFSVNAPLAWANSSLAFIFHFFQVNSITSWF
jgi:hypothetical protein